MQMETLREPCTKDRRRWAPVLPTPRCLGRRSCCRRFDWAGGTLGDPYACASHWRRSLGCAALSHSLPLLDRIFVAGRRDHALTERQADSARNTGTLGGALGSKIRILRGLTRNRTWVTCTQSKYTIHYTINPQSDSREFFRFIFHFSISTIHQLATSARTGRQWKNWKREKGIQRSACRRRSDKAAQASRRGRCSGGGGRQTSNEEKTLKEKGVQPAPA